MEEGGEEEEIKGRGEKGEKGVTKILSKIFANGVGVFVDLPSDHIHLPTSEYRQTLLKSIYEGEEKGESLKGGKREEGWRLEAGRDNRREETGTMGTCCVGHRTHRSTIVRNITSSYLYIKKYKHKPKHKT